MAKDDKNKNNNDDAASLESMRKRFYDPEPGETDYSETMSFDEYVKKIGPGRANGGMVKGFSPIARPQKFKGVF